MANNVFRVTSPSGGVCEYFDSRNNAILFIVDEFTTALAFRDEDERMRLSHYMCYHDETPNQYPFKYKIEEIKLNKEYNEPNKIYSVKIDLSVCGLELVDIFIFKSQSSAKEFFYRLVDDDVHNNSNKPNVVSKLSPFLYERCYDGVDYVNDHLKLNFVEYIENDDGQFLVKK